VILVFVVVQAQVGLVVGEFRLSAVVAAAAHGHAALGATLEEIDPNAATSATAAEQLIVSNATAGFLAVVRGTTGWHKVRAKAGWKSHFKV